MCNKCLWCVSVLTLFFSSVGCAQAPESQSQLLEDLRILSSDEYEGRATGTPGNMLARSYLTERFQDIGLESCGETLAQSFPIRGGREGVNLIGKIEGTNSPDSYIVLSAHYDHLGIRNDRIFNGADDNASGTAALLAIATHFLANPPEHSLVIAAFDAEEIGLVGARAFVQDPCIPRESIVINVNMDMISRSSTHQLYVSGLSHYPFLKDYVDDIDSGRDFSLLFGHDSSDSGLQDWTGSSDHAPFHASNIPFLYFGVEDHEGYHNPTDDFDKISPVFYSAVVDGVIEVLTRIDEKLDAIRDR